jgi:hypothetical protein
MIDSKPPGKGVFLLIHLLEFSRGVGTPGRAARGAHSVDCVGSRLCEPAKQSQRRDRSYVPQTRPVATLAFTPRPPRPKRRRV